MALRGGNPDPHDNSGESRQTSPCPLCGDAVVSLGTHLRYSCEGVDDA
jgi:hypothetical protein